MNTSCLIVLSLSSIRCASGYQYDYQCPGGTLFDAELNYCDWAINVNCIVMDEVLSSEEDATDDERDIETEDSNGRSL